MSQGINISLADTLHHFIQTRVSSSGLYGSADEYIGDLVRRDYEREEERKWGWLRDELTPGTQADESEFIPLDANAVLQKAKALRQADAR